MAQLYDRADIYDLIESDERTENIRRDWKGFLGGRNIRTMLDVSIGTGGMTLPLQELGILISGSDLNQTMLDRCGMKAEAKGKPVELKRSDFRDLSCWDGRKFDCVASTGNSLAYVVNDDVRLALAGMDRLVRPGDSCALIPATGKRYKKKNSVFICTIRFSGTATGSTWCRCGTIMRTVP